MRNMKELTKEEMRKFIEMSTADYLSRNGKVIKMTTVLGKGLLSSNTAIPRSSSSKMRLGKGSGRMFTAESGMKLKVT